MGKLDIEASGKAATGSITSTSQKTPGDGAAEGDMPTDVCSEENPAPSGCDDKTQACSADSTTKPQETCDTPTDDDGSDPSNGNVDNNSQSDEGSSSPSQSNDPSAPDSSGQA